MSYSGSDPWGYNSYDGMNFSNSADAASWAAAGGSGGALTPSFQVNGNYLDSLTRLADTYLRVNGAVEMQKADNGRLTYREGQAGYAMQAPVGFSISPGLLVLAGLGVFLFMAKD